MNYENYEDYMRNVLGYRTNMNYSNMYMNNQTPYQNMYLATNSLERMYPDTYQIVYPMVVSACNMVNMPITEEMLDRMTDDIYDRAIADSRINIDINIEIESREDNDMEITINSNKIKFHVFQLYLNLLVSLFY